MSPRDSSLSEIAQSLSQRIARIGFPSAKRDKPSDSGWLFSAMGVTFAVIVGAFLIKLTLDSGWLTPMRQVALATAVGVSLIGLGTGTIVDHREFRFRDLYSGAGVIVLFLCVYGGLLHARLFNLVTATGLIAIVAGTSVVLFTRTGNLFFASASVVGTYLVPILIRVADGEAPELPGYFLAWDIVFCLVAIVLNNRLILLLATYLCVLAFILSYPALSLRESDTSYVRAALFQFFQVALFAVMTVYFSVSRKLPLAKSEAWAMFPCLILAYGIEYFLVQQVAPGFAPYAALTLSALIYGAYAFAAHRLGPEKLQSRTMILAFLTALVFHVAYLDLLPARAAPWVGVGVFLVLPRLASRFDIFGKSRVVGAGLGLAILLEYGRCLFFSESIGSTFEVAALNVAYGASMLGSFFIYRRNRSYWLVRVPIVVLAQVQILAALYRLATWSSQTLNIENRDRFVVSLFWCAGAIILFELARRMRRDIVLASSSIAIFLIAMLKVFTYDLASAAAPTRILFALATPIVLFACLYLCRQVLDWRTAD